jgi:hypothetical protein
MAMSNAERQRRYRQKLKARASGDALGDRVRDAVERAIDALWAFHERPAPGGIRWSDIDGCTSLEIYRAELQRSPDNLLQACRAFMPECEGLTDAEIRAICAIIEIADALRLTHAATLGELVKMPPPRPTPDIAA